MIDPTLTKWQLGTLRYAETVFDQMPEGRAATLRVQGVRSQQVHDALRRVSAQWHNERLHNLARRIEEAIEAPIPSDEPSLEELEEQTIIAYRKWLRVREGDLSWIDRYNELQKAFEAYRAKQEETA